MSERLSGAIECDPDLFVSLSTAIEKDSIAIENDSIAKESKSSGKEVESPIAMRQEQAGREQVSALDAARRGSQQDRCDGRSAYALTAIADQVEV